MDYAACHVVYVDRRIASDRHEDRKIQPVSSKKSLENIPGQAYVQHNVGVLLSVFNRGKQFSRHHLCEVAVAMSHNIVLLFVS